MAKTKYCLKIEKFEKSKRNEKSKGVASDQKQVNHGKNGVSSKNPRNSSDFEKQLWNLKERRIKAQLTDNASKSTPSLIANPTFVYMPTSVGFSSDVAIARLTAENEAGILPVNHATGSIECANVSRNPFSTLNTENDEKLYEITLAPATLTLPGRR